MKDRKAPGLGEGSVKGEGVVPDQTLEKGEAFREMPEVQGGSGEATEKQRGVTMFGIVSWRRRLVAIVESHTSTVDEVTRL